MPDVASPTIWTAAREGDPRRTRAAIMGDDLEAVNRQAQPIRRIPLHGGWTSYSYRQLERWICESDLAVGLGTADQPGDRFVVRRGTIEKTWI